MDAELAPYQVENVLRQISQRGVSRAQVQAFEDVMNTAPPEAHRKLPVEHRFAPGLYMRILSIPAGILLTGKIHKYSCISILSKGKIATLVDDNLVIVTAPHVQRSAPGLKRIGYALQDTVWMTLHETDETNIARIEADLVCDTEEQYQAFLVTQERMKCLS